MLRVEPEGAVLLTMIEPLTNSGSWIEIRRELRAVIARKVAPADVDDIVQEVLIRAQRSLSTLRDSERFGPWLYRIVRNAIASHHRGKRRTVPAGEDELEIIADPEIEDAADRLSSCIAPLVAALPSPYREALTLVELEGTTQTAAAEILGISASGMKSRVQRGRKKLRELFEDCCDVTLDVRSRVVDFGVRGDNQRACACSGPSNTETEIHDHGCGGARSSDPGVLVRPAR